MLAWCPECSATLRTGECPKCGPLRYPVPLTLAEALEDARAESRCAEQAITLTRRQCADLIAIRDAWNADRRARRVSFALTAEDCLSKILATMKGIVT